MKQIIPFKKDLLFKTKVSEITSISLEHSIAIKNSNKISGEFHITGDYKMTEASINRENFKFKIPFDIELESKYIPSTLTVDIDNFYYEVINNEALQVNIDLYIEGEKEKEEKVIEVPSETEQPKEMNIEIPNLEKTEITSSFFPKIEEEKPMESSFEEREEKLIPEITSPKKDTIIFEEKQKKTSQQNFNLFENIDNSDTYITYYVYIVKEQDTIDSIMKKYNIDKETLNLYNNLEEMKPGMKLIIPNKNE